jgi:hypothetical protein
MRSERIEEKIPSREEAGGWLSSLSMRPLFEEDCLQLEYATAKGKDSFGLARHMKIYKDTGSFKQ